ncbi:SGNH/GDSL hydrolase family protein [Algoriphagus namhaensis]
MLSQKDIKSFFTITLPTLLVMLIVVELILRWFMPVPDPFERFKTPADKNSYILSQFKPHSYYNFEVESRLPLMDSSVVYSTNNLGYRGDSLILDKPADEFRIFLVGGSTTENLFIDDRFGLERSLQEKLQDSLPQKTIKVYNAGKSGDATPDHLAMLVHRIQHLNPDLVVLFPGINDLNRLVAGYDYLHFPIPAERVESPLAQSIKFFLSNFQIVRRIINLKPSEETNARTTIALKTNYLDKVREVQELPLASEVPSYDASIYERNVLSFLGALQANGVQSMLMTQTHTWDTQDEFLVTNHWMTGIGEQRFEPNQLASKLNELNDILERIANETGTPILDLEARIPKTKDYFYDDCHFNKGGINFASELMREFILNNNYLPIEL